MPDHKKRLPVGERLRRAFAKEHESWIDYVAELEPYVRANPDDKWAAGQLKFAHRRIKELTEKIGAAVNRQDRPTQ